MSRLKCLREKWELYACEQLYKTSQTKELDRGHTKMGQGFVKFSVHAL